MSRARLRDPLEYAGARTLEAAVSGLPEAVADHLGERLGALAFSPFGVRREVAEANLRAAFPEATETWVREVAAAAFRHLGREAVAVLRLARLGREEMIARTEMVGWDALQAGLAEGRGAVLTTGHFGNWEFSAAAIAARGIPIEAIVKRQRNRRFDAHLNATRHRLGIETVEQQRAPGRVPRALRAGHIVGFVADQDARRAGIFVPFFGRPASTHRGPALFALRFGAPVFAITARRLPGIPARYRVTLDRVPVQPTGELETDILRLTSELTARLEVAIRAAPEQYFWFHRRWKSRPRPELDPTPGGTTPSGDGDGTETDPPEGDSIPAQADV